ncbi:MAG: M28 family peptidase [Treponema sp.]|nr:M28 family peptidase [Treponema sp.]
MSFLKIRGRPFAEPPFDRFFEFIAPNADRHRILKSLLKELGIESLVFTVAGNRHFFIFPRREGPEPDNPPAGDRVFPFPGKNPVILTAHYDRAAGSPGANDNSVAVFLLIKAAGLLRTSGTGNWITILTDKEELGPGEGICSQGSYTLAETLRRNGLGRGRIFIFDSCGTGDTLIVSSTADYLFNDYSFSYFFNRAPKGLLKARQLTRELRIMALETARNLNMDKVLLLPTPFSEDAGFLKAGLAAVTITALPSREASSFVSLLRKRPDFPGALIARENRQAGDEPLIPETWRRLNGPKDLPSRLTPEHYGGILRFAQQLCKN